MLGRGLHDKVLDIFMRDETDHWRGATLTGSTQEHALLKPTTLEQSNGL